MSPSTQTLICAVVAAITLAAPPATGATLPPGFQEEIVFSGLTQPTAVRFSPDGRVFAKGLVRYRAAPLKEIAGSRTGQLAEGLPHEVVHRDDLVVLP